MKKIFYLILTILFIFLVSSYTSPNMDKKVIPGDSISVNINVHQTKLQQPKSDELYTKLVTALDNNATLDLKKGALIDKIMQEDKQQSITTLDRLCSEKGVDTDTVIKEANRSVLLSFIGSLIIILFTGAVIILFIKKSIRDKLDWKATIVLSLLILVGLYFINGQIQNILQYIFNSEYLTIKEIIKFF